MAISDKLNKINNDLINAYNSINSKGGTIPNNKNTENLASAINSIQTGGGTLNGMELVSSGNFTPSNNSYYNIDTGTEYADLIIVYYEDYGTDTTSNATVLFISMYISIENIVYPATINNSKLHNIYIYGRRNPSSTNTPYGFASGSTSGGYYLENGHYYFKCYRITSSYPLKTAGKYYWKAYKYTNNQ